MSRAVVGGVTLVMLAVVGIAIGIAASAAIFEHQAEALSVRAGIVAGLDSVLLAAAAAAAAVAFAAAVLAWPLLGALRSTTP